MATVRPRRVSVALINLAHAARADGRKDLVRAEPFACGERHIERLTQFSRSTRVVPASRATLRLPFADRPHGRSRRVADHPDEADSGRMVSLAGLWTP